MGGGRLMSCLVMPSGAAGCGLLWAAGAVPADAHAGRHGVRRLAQRGAVAGRQRRRAGHAGQPGAHRADQCDHPGRRLRHGHLAAAAVPAGAPRCSPCTLRTGSAASCMRPALYRSPTWSLHGAALLACDAGQVLCVSTSPPLRRPDGTSHGKATPACKRDLTMWSGPKAG